MVSICDTHAHYDSRAFDADREILLREELPSAGVEMVVNVGATMKGAEESAHFAEKYGYFHAACGIHPDEVGVFEHAGGRQPVPGPPAGAEGEEEALERLREAERFKSAEEALEHLYELCRRPKTAAVGEIGLDYHWMVEPKEVQRRWFVRQLELARELDLPVNVHSRDAAQDTFDSVRDAALKTGGIIHCYSGSAEMALDYVRMGYHIGIGGVVTFKNSKTLKRVVQEVPPEALVTETDCPYLAPSPNRGKRNDSRNIRYVIAEIARLKEMEEEACAEILRKNAHEVYHI